MPERRSRKNNSERRQILAPDSSKQSHHFKIIFASPYSYTAKRWILAQCFSLQLQVRELKSWASAKTLFRRISFFPARPKRTNASQVPHVEQIRQPPFCGVAYLPVLGTNRWRLFKELDGVACCHQQHPANVQMTETSWWHWVISLGEHFLQGVRIYSRKCRIRIDRLGAKLPQHRQKTKSQSGLLQRL